ncbi:McrB family protein [Methylobacterium tardum]|uniref:McrB family protein n=1 Tax=Methylobacterium tardum TaxID=374432 RepID=UPI00361D483B
MIMTPEKVRQLTVENLGIASAVASTPDAPAPALSAADTSPEDLELPEGDEVLAQLLDAIDLGYAGIILVGPPGTSKSWYAKRLAHAYAGDADATDFVQFHTSYQYEDFMVGFVPDAAGRFQPVKRTLPIMCEKALARPDTQHVLVIGEISRCDAARVFGEALTYVEMDKRKLPFRVASGLEMTIPENLVIIATMNPWDKGVDDMDIAFERRFARVEMPPSPDLLREILLAKGAEQEFVERMLAFYEGIQRLDDEYCRLGHAYFINAVNDTSARRIWAFSLDPFFKRACRFLPETYKDIRRMWRAFEDGAPAPEVEASTDPEAVPAGAPGAAA